MKRILAALTGLTLALAPAPAGAEPTNPSVDMDCSMPTPTDISPWYPVSAAGQVRGFGAWCGDPRWDYQYAVYVWDRVADGGCVSIWAKQWFADHFTPAAGLQACGRDVVKWQVRRDLFAARELRVVYGYWAASATIWRA